MTYAVTYILDSGIAGVQLRDNCGREYPKWVRDKVVAEPREACSISNRKTRKILKTHMFLAWASNTVSKSASTGTAT
jgi:hypothetical protein